MTKRLGIVVHQHRPAAVDYAKRARVWAKGNGVTLSMPTSDAKLLGCEDLGSDESDFGPGLDAGLSVGGDGTMLRTIDMLAPHGVPVLGINAGTLGYLTEIDPSDLESALDAWLNGDLEIQERMMLEVCKDEVHLGVALNELVVERANSGRTVALKTSISGRAFTTFYADGLIVGTPTGSTAYSLSAGGPIVEPDFEAILVTPVAPHMVFDRSLVLAPSTEVELQVEGYRAAAVTLDGRQIALLQPGEKVLCRRSSTRAKLLVSGERNFHAILKEKFGLTDR
jgi:NAD+ kinase